MNKKKKVQTKNDAKKNCNVLLKNAIKTFRPAKRINYRYIFNLLKTRLKRFPQ